MPSSYSSGQVLPNTTTAGTNLITNATVLVQIPSTAVSVNGGSIQYTIPKTTANTKATPYILGPPTSSATQTTSKMSVQETIYETMIETEPTKVIMPEDHTTSEQVVLESEEDANLTDDLDETKFLVPKKDSNLDLTAKKKYVTQSKTTKPEYPFVCSCGKSYKIKGSLKRHQSYECGVIPSLTCKYCPHKSKYKSDLRKHILQKHSHLDPDVNSSVLLT